MADYHECIYNLDPLEWKKYIENSNLFSIDSAKNPNEYKIETYKMIGYISRYMYSINEPENINYGVEIAEVAERCIKFYNPDSETPFLHYFNKAWHVELSRIKGKEYQDNLVRGIHVNRKVMEQVRKYIRLAQNRGTDYLSESYISFMSDAIDRNQQEIREYINLLSYGVAPEFINDEDNTEYELLDMFDVKDTTLEDTIIDNEVLKDRIKDINEVFESIQERQKQLISELLTLRIVDSKELDDIVLSELFNTAFFSKPLYFRITNGEHITARTISNSFNVTEQSSSRSLRQFLEKIKRKY